MNKYLPLFVIALILISCQQNKQTDTNAIPEWGLGPFVRDSTAPKIGALSKSTFDCPLSGRKIKWEDKGVLCASAVVKDGKVFLFYRAEDNSRKPSWGTSRIGLAISENGKDFVRYRHPVLYPDNDFMQKYEWPGGCQDPRIIKTEDGNYVLTYMAWDGKIGRLCVAVSTDLYKWEKKGLAFSNCSGGKYNDAWTKAGAIVCRKEGDQFIATKINGKYWMYFGDSGLMLAKSDDLTNWEIVENSEGKPLIVLPMRPEGWDDNVTESGAIALITDKGIHMIYNGGARDGSKHFGLEGMVWAMAQALFDKNDLTKVLARTSTEFFRPERDFERNYVGPVGGGAGNVTFAEGLIWFNNEWRLYYGCADSWIASAVFKP